MEKIAKDEIINQILLGLGFNLTESGENQNYHKRYKTMIQLFTDNFSKIPINSFNILLSLFFSENWNIKSIINTLFAINQCIAHYDYFERLAREDNLDQRLFDDSLYNTYIQNPQNHNFVFFFNNFKTKALGKSDDGTENIYYKNTKDKRRQVTLDCNSKNIFKVYLEYFNYICIPCSKQNCMNDNCPFSHNQYEIKYHPLVLKTKFCLNKNCNNEYCSEAHNLTDDFRIIYNQNKNGIIDIIRYSEAGGIFQTENFLKKEINDILPFEFNPNSYKTVKCPLGKFCKLDRKLCLNYHVDKERRRDLRAIFYDANICTSVFDSQEKQWLEPENCANVNYYLKLG
jgi:hypothetical protein